MFRETWSAGSQRMSAWFDAQKNRHALLALASDSFASFMQNECLTTAAALSYYTLLAFFPLWLLLIAIFSPFLASDQVITVITGIVRGIVPTAALEVRNILRQVVAAHGAVEVFAAVGFVWSVSGVFDLVQRGLNRAWQVHAPRSLWQTRLISLVMVIGVVLLLAGSFALSATLRSMALARPVHTPTTRAIDFAGLATSALISIVLFAVVYRTGPHVKLRWRDVLPGALVGGLGWEIGKEIFTYYVVNFAHLSFVYGSLGTVIAILTWIYISAVIFLFGAELDAARARQRQNAQNIPPSPTLDLQ